MWLMSHSSVDVFSVNIFTETFHISLLNYFKEKSGKTEIGLDS